MPAAMRTWATTTSSDRPLPRQRVGKSCSPAPVGSQAAVMTASQLGACRAVSRLLGSSRRAWAGRDVWMAEHDQPRIRQCRRAVFALSKQLHHRNAAWTTFVLCVKHSRSSIVLNAIISGKL